MINDLRERALLEYKLANAVAQMFWAIRHCLKFELNPLSAEMDSDYVKDCVIDVVRSSRAIEYHSIKKG